MSNNNFQRRNRLDLNEPAELAIHKAIEVVEKLSADERLTNAVLKLQEAKKLVSDYFDGIPLEKQKDIKIQYQLLVQDDHISFQEELSEAVEKGWVPHSNLSVTIKPSLSSMEDHIEMYSIIMSKH